MQNRGNFVLNKACYLMNIDDADLCVYPKSISGKNKKVITKPHPTPPTHLLKNFPQFVVTHTVKGFSIVNKAEVDVFLELSCFFDDPTDVGNLISGSLSFLNPA